MAIFSKEFADTASELFPTNKGLHYAIRHEDIEGVGAAIYALNSPDTSEKKSDLERLNALWTAFLDSHDSF